MSTDGLHPSPPLEVVATVDEAAIRVFDHGGKHGGELLLCTHDGALDEPSLERIAMAIRWVSVATYDQTSPFWEGGPVLAVDLNDAEIAMVRHDPRVALVVLARRDAQIAPPSR